LVASVFVARYFEQANRGKTNPTRAPPFCIVSRHISDNPSGMMRLLVTAIVAALIACVAFSFGSWHRTGRFRIERLGDSTFVTLDTVTGALHYSGPTYAGDEQGWVQTNRAELHVPWINDPRVTKVLPSQDPAVAAAHYSVGDSSPCR
jgi:hypothetical protein